MKARGLAGEGQAPAFSFVSRDLDHDPEKP